MHPVLNAVEQATCAERRPRHSRVARSVGMLLGCVLVLLPWLRLAAAQAAPPDTPPRTEGDQRKSSEQAPQGPAATVDGFRAARFGMTEEQVRQAIGKDFPGFAGKLKKANHRVEKTAVLSLPVNDLLPSTGTAQVSYILGYKSKKLIQINVVWHSDGSEDSDEIVVGTANSLRDYFAAQNYKPGSAVANRQLNENTIVVFRAADAQDRIVLVLLSGAAAAARKAEKQPPAPPLTLTVSYIADPSNPDVFRIGKGQF